jgi:signal transduction histidine kinase
VVAAVGLVASVALLAAQSVYLVLRILWPIRSLGEAAQQLARGAMKGRVPQVGVGEVAILGSSFNAMAEALQSRDVEISRAKERLERAVQEASEASAKKSNFLANMRHEIRTPLNRVIGMMSLLGETQLSDKQREDVDAAKSSGDALITVVKRHPGHREDRAGSAGARAPRLRRARHGRVDVRHGRGQRAFQGAGAGVIRP